jgi:hypothetical protein
MPDILARLTTPLVVGLILTASTLVIFNGWRLSIVALAVQYVLAAALVVQIVVVQVAVVKALVGLLVVGILAYTGREVNFGRVRQSAQAPSTPEAQAAAPASRFQFSTNFPFRVLAVVMFVVAAWYTASQPRFALPGLPLGVNVASYLLVALGLLNLGLTEEPLNAGMGLLTVLIGFEMLYVVFEQSLAVAALLAAVEFGVALAVSYLALLSYAASEKEMIR